MNSQAFLGKLEDSHLSNTLNNTIWTVSRFYFSWEYVILIEFTVNSAFYGVWTGSAQFADVFL